MKKILSATTLAILLSVVSCQKEDVSETVQDASNEIPAEVINKLESLYFNTDDVKVMNLENIDGTFSKTYVAGGDISFTYDELMSLEDEPNGESRQFRTKNIVTKKKDIRVVAYSYNNRYGLSKTAIAAVKYAVKNYNDLNIDIKLNVVVGTQYTGKDIVVYVDNNINKNNVSSGLAGFPKNGYAFSRVKINNYANNNQSIDQLEHLITHEIGHTIGMRHTDWNTRYTCGQSKNEGAGEFGVVYIPGTAQASSDRRSIMNACYPNDTNGEFSFNDRKALRYIY